MKWLTSKRCYYIASLRYNENVNINKRNGARFEWGVSVCHLRCSSLNFDLCLHLFAISLRLFSVFNGSLLSISYFSVMQRSHLRVPHLYGRDFRWISHLIFGSFSSFLSFQIYCDNFVDVCLKMLLKLYLWLEYRSLNSVSVLHFVCLCLHFHCTPN